MDFEVTVRVALRSLERHKLRSFLTMLGIVIGIAAVVASVSFGEGASHMVQAQIANMGTNLLYAFAGSMGRGGAQPSWCTWHHARGRGVDGRTRRAAYPGGRGGTLGAGPPPRYGPLPLRGGP